MNILSRSILIELLKLFCFWLVIMTLVMMLITIGTEAVRMNLGIGPTLKLIPFVMPTALTFAVPATILFATCFVYGRMSAENEVVAVKSMGISPLVILSPVLALSFLLSLVGVWLNDVSYSWGHSGMQRVVLQSIEEIVYGLLRSQRSYANPRFSILVKSVEGRRLMSPIITFQPNNDMPAFTLTAKEAELQSNLQESTLSLILIDCKMDTDDGLSFDWPGRTVQDIPLTYAAAKDLGDSNPAHLPIRKMGAAIEAQKQAIVELEQSVAAETGLALLTGDFDMLDQGTWQKRQNSVQNAKLRLYRLQCEPWRRWATGFCCLAFVLIGAPLSIMMRNSDYLTTFFWSFLTVLGYYAFLSQSLTFVKSGAAPPVILWTGNIVYIVAGVLLIRRVLKN